MEGIWVHFIRGEGVGSNDRGDRGGEGEEGWTLNSPNSLPFPALWCSKHSPRRAKKILGKEQRKNVVNKWGIEEGGRGPQQQQSTEQSCVRRKEKGEKRASKARVVFHEI